MFVRSARYYDLLYDFKNYETASGQLHQLIQSRHPAARTLLDVACGSGRHLSSLRHHYRVEGLDVSEDLLALAAARCAGVPLHRADMLDFDLGRSFDVVTCLFSSIAYLKTITRIRRAVANMARHLNPGGLLLIEPWFTPERYWTGTITSNVVTRPDLRIAWMYTSEREGDVSVLDINFLVGTPQRVEHFTERHEFGLITHEEYLGAMRAVGLETEYRVEGFFGRGMYGGRAPLEGAVDRDAATPAGRPRAAGSDQATP
jgi:SAM-dependent methyltransferase